MVDGGWTVGAGDAPPAAELMVVHRHPESSVFHRPLGRALPAIARGEGALLWDTEGRRYLDGSGGAVVVNVGHGRREIAAAMARQAAAAAYVHGTQFTSGVLEEYARRLAPRARRLPAAVPGVGRLGGERDRGEAGARLPARRGPEPRATR